MDFAADAPALPGQALQSPKPDAALYIQLVNPFIYCFLRRGVIKISPFQPVCFCGSLCLFFQMDAAVPDPAADGSAERHNGLPLQIYIFHKRIDNVRRFSPPDRISDINNICIFYSFFDRFQI